MVRKGTMILFSERALDILTRLKNNFEMFSEEGRLKQYLTHVGGRGSTMCSLPEEVVRVL